ncbi:MAG: V-type ATPase 116kDa subunit family protein [Candidatus Thermoplasmatota archaeon]|nr:V-type ATPase 116kDa subunit family protein [Candidatus Thermoplasmatota archaeon]
MSQFTTESMSRLIVAGTREQLAATVRVVADLRAVHINDYVGNDEGLSLGKPEDASEDVSRRLTRIRGCAALIEAQRQTELLPASDVRSHLSASIDDMVEASISRFEEIDSKLAEIAQIDETLSVLSQLVPLSLELELMDGYDSLTSHVGTVRSLVKARPDIQALGDRILFLSGEVGKQGVVAIFSRNEDADKVHATLGEHDFQPIAIPEGEGQPRELITTFSERKATLESEIVVLESEAESWSAENGGMLFGGLELLERDLTIHTAPVRVAVSEHAFVMDGWVMTRSSEEVSNALSSVCTYVEIEDFEEPAHHGHHHDEKVEMPPIAFAPRHHARSFEMLTDVMGRPEYGRVDPTMFMLITYPLFFGMILGDMAYGLAVIGMGAFMWRRFPLDDTMRNASRFLFAIGISTVIFGYIYGEFAGFEFLPHGHCDIEGIVGVAQCEAAHGHYHWEAAHAPSWVSWMTALYPHGGEMHYVLQLKFGAVFAYPFHRVSANLEHLILLTIYMGVAHIMLGLVLGFRDIVKAHGWVDAMFEKGSWMFLLVGGFLFSYSFLVKPGHTDPDYVALLDNMFTIGLVLVGIGVLMVMVLLYHYEKMGAVGIPLAVLESLGLLPKVVSYVRIFAVGVVGVKIAATGNEMLYEGLAHTLGDLSHAGTLDLVLIPVILVVWLGVQLFALVLGVFSPNIHTVRLHFVEWMMQFYEGSGLPFKPFGFKPGRVEIE